MQKDGGWRLWVVWRLLESRPAIGSVLYKESNSCTYSRLNLHILTSCFCFCESSVSCFTAVPVESKLLRLGLDTGFSW